jgi:hypothetical protein
MQEWTLDGTRAATRDDLTSGRKRIGRHSLTGLRATHLRGVAQLGSASALGAEGRRFKSGHPDGKKQKITA